MSPDTFTDFSIHVAPTDDGGTDVAIFGELDVATGDQAREAIAPVLNKPKGHVVIDLRACPFIDSTGVGILVQAALRLREKQRTLRLRGVGDRVRRTLDLAGLTSSELIEIEPERGKPQQ
jgi:anti-anti-sigma factor